VHLCARSSASFCYFADLSVHNCVLDVIILEASDLIHAPFCGNVADGNGHDGRTGRMSVEAG
jgi:hypothetical protein